MYCRSRPQYRSDLGWISGVAFLGTLPRSARPVQGFTCVRCCSMPPASSPHGLAAPGLGRLTTAIPACSCLQLAVATNSLRRGLPPPIQCPCLAHQGCSLRSHRLQRLKPLTPTLSPATHSAMPSMLPCCTSDLKRRPIREPQPATYPIGSRLRTGRSPLSLCSTSSRATCFAAWRAPLPPIRLRARRL